MFKGYAVTVPAKGLSMLGGGALAGSVQTYPFEVDVAAGIGNTASVLILVVFKTIESPKQIIGCIGVTAMVN